MKEKAINLRRPLLFILAVAMVMMNLFSAGVVFAEETESMVSYADDEETDQTLFETEASLYRVNLPYLEGCLYSYDQTHRYVPEDVTSEEHQDIILNYKKDEEVKLEILTSDQYEVADLHLYNKQIDENTPENGKDRQEPAYTWDPQTGKLDFFMPEEDLFLELKIVEKETEVQTEYQVPITENANEYTVFDEQEDQSLDSNYEETYAGETYDDGSASDVFLESTVESQENDGNIQSDTSFQEEPEKPQSYELVMEMDGMPTQGSIIQMETLTIPFDTWDFDPEHDYTNITFSAQEYDITYISDDIDYVTPGVYSCIYRIQQRDTERFWYALRPVRVEAETVSEDMTENVAIEDKQENISEEYQESASLQENGIETEANDVADEIEEVTEDANLDNASDEDFVLAEIIGTTFDLYKVNADDESEKLEGIKFRLFSTADVEAEKVRQIAEAVEALRKEQQAVGASANIAAATALGKLLQEYDAQATVIREEYAQKFLDYQAEGHTEEEILAYQQSNDILLQTQLQEKKGEYEEKILALMAEQKEKAKTLTAEHEQAVIDLEKKMMSELQISEDQIAGSEYVTDAEGHIHLEKLIAGTTYFLYEISTIPGFNLDTNRYEFEVDQDGLINGEKNYSMTVTNQPNHLEISKKTEDGKMLSGAKMEVRSINEDGSETIIDSWETDENAHLISALPAGNYRLIELEAPAGYAVAPEISFAVSNSMETQKIDMVDDHLVVHVTKKDIATDQMLSGAELAVKDTGGNVVAQWISTEETYSVNLLEGEYVLTEVTAPEGYVKADDIHFIVSSERSEQDLVMYSYPKTKVVITKLDAETQKAVSGALLGIYGSDGSEIGKWVTTETPYELLMNPGEYTLRELEAPAEYVSAEDITFKIQPDSYKEIKAITMVDTPIRVTISKKDLITGEEIPGAKLRITDSEGQVEKEWKSDKEPVEFILAKGTHTLSEISAPKGYEVADAVTIEVLDTAEEQNFTIYDMPIDELVNLTGKKKEITSTGEMQVTGGIQSSSGNGKNFISSAVKTGDFNRYLLPVILVSGGILMGMVLFITRKKQKK